MYSPDIQTEVCSMAESTVVEMPMPEAVYTPREIAAARKVSV